MKTPQIVIGAVAALALAGGGFAAGMTYEKSQSATATAATTTRSVRTTETDVKLTHIKPNDQVTVVGTTDSTGMVSATAIVVGQTNILGQLFGTQTGNPGALGGRTGPAPSPTKAP